MKMMEKVNHTFISVTGHSISFMDRNGQSVLPFNLNIFSEFCRYVINSEQGGPKCIECNSLITPNGEDLRPRITQCHMGLTMITVPIMVNGKVMIRIADNGVGMNREMVDRILNRQVEPSRVQTSGMGIRNVQERLDLVFADQYTLEFKSNPDEGTEVIIYLPLVKERREADGADFDR